MKVSVIGLGYVGCVTSACLAKLGHEVLGVDVDPSRVAMLRRGDSPLSEPGLDSLLQEAVNTGRLKVVSELSSYLNDVEMIFVCVGTPSSSDGTPNLKYLHDVFDVLETGLVGRTEPLIISIRSTVLPGTSSRFETQLQKTLGQHVVVCSHPEFLREGSAVKDFFYPSFIVVGTRHEYLLSSFIALYRELPNFSPEMIHRTDPEAAEMLKYACNAFHALKVTFANEIGTLCQTQGIDSQVVMNLFVQDTKLNISKAYLQPGFAFGGSCLPKDLRALTAFGSQHGYFLPLLNAVLISNQRHLRNTVKRILDQSPRRVLLWGMAFKAKTDDTRESPAVDLLAELLNAGVEVRWYDPLVAEALKEGNAPQTVYLLSKVPNAETLCVHQPEEFRDYPNLHVVTQHDERYRIHLEASNAPVLDLTGKYRDVISSERYIGLLW